MKKYPFTSSRMSNNISHLIALLIVICIYVPFSTCTICYSCVGADCNYGECSGDICYSGLHPVGPFTPERPLHVKGCVSGAINQTTEVMLNRTRAIFASAPESYFCDWDLCNAPKYVAKHAKAVNAALNNKKGGYAVCKRDTPFDKDVEDVCQAEWCWVGMVHPRSSVEGTVLRGCSGFTIGVHTGSYCVSPPVLDLMTHAPLYTINNQSMVCFCREETLCNRGTPASLEHSYPLLTITISYTKGVGMELSGSGNIWLMDTGESMPEPIRYSLTGPGFTVFVETEWTPAGHDYHEWTLSTTPLPTGDDVIIDDSELSINDTDPDAMIGGESSGDEDGSSIMKGVVSNETEMSESAKKQPISEKQERRKEHKGVQRGKGKSRDAIDEDKLDNPSNGARISIMWPCGYLNFGMGVLGILVAGIEQR